MDLDHEVSVIGWGIENGEKYWIISNSWGQHWGVSGFFRLIRGVNNLAIESDCNWAIPQDTWTNQLYHNTTQDEKNDPRNNVTNGPYPLGPPREEKDKEFLKDEDLTD